MNRILFVLIMISYTAIFGQVNLNSSLTACYALDGNASEPVYNLTGTLSAVTPTTGHFGVTNTAYHFKGQSSSIIKLPVSALLKPNEISFSAWVKIDTLGPDMTILFARNTSTVVGYSAFYALTVKYYDGAYRFGVLRQKDYTGYYPGSTTTLTVNNWYHVAFAMSTSTMQVYVNGVYESFLYTPTSFTYDPSKNVILGGTNENTSSSFKGCIDNVRFYSRVLSAGEMSELYYWDPVCGTFATGLQESASESEVRVYPNPTGGKFFVGISDEKIKEYEVVDLLGSLILKGKPDTDKNIIDLNNYPNGIYFLKIRNEDLFKTIKIVKE